MRQGDGEDLQVGLHVRPLPPEEAAWALYK